MPAFDAGTVVEALEFTFEPYVKGCKGVIKEPSDEQIATFMAGMRERIADARKLGMEELKTDEAGQVDPEQLVDALDALTPEQTVAQLRRMSELYGALCSGRPSADQISRLPLRRRAAFFAWFQKEAINPEAGPGAGTAQVIKLPAAAAG
jgi:hypothetical protein